MLRNNSSVFLLSQQQDSNPDFTILRKRRLSSLKNQSRSNNFSLNFGKMNEKLICFPILSDNIPGRRESSDWNDFIQLGMQEDGNPIRSLRRSRAGKSSLGENSRLETTWNSTITPIQDTTNSLPIQSSSNSNLISPRRNSNRLLSLGGPQANTGRSIYDLASSIVPTINATLKAAAGLELPNKKIKKLKVVEQLKEEGNETMKEEKKISVKKAKKPEGYVGRPPNAWILYRSEQIRILKTDNAKIKKPQSDISKFIGMMWRDETVQVRKKFEDLAEIAKAEHSRLHPDYKFQPIRKVKESTVNIKSDSDLDSDSNSPIKIIQQSIQSNSPPKRQLESIQQLPSKIRSPNQKSRAPSPSSQGRFHPTLPRRDYIVEPPSDEIYMRTDSRKKLESNRNFPTPPTSGEEGISLRPGISIDGFLSSLQQQDHYSSSSQSQEQSQQNQLERSQEDREAWLEYEASTKKWFPPSPPPTTTNLLDQYLPCRNSNGEFNINDNSNNGGFYQAQHWELLSNRIEPEINYTMSYQSQPQQEQQQHQERNYDYTPNVGLGGCSEIPRDDSFLESNSRNQHLNSSHQEQRQIFQLSNNNQSSSSSSNQYNFPNQSSQRF